MADAFAQDPGLLADVVTESRELNETVHQDLVALERAPDDMELLNRVFRALHTIKGSSSFLGLDELTHFAHAGEDALNAMRKGEATLDAAAMDALLQAVDVVRGQIDTAETGAAPEAGPDELVRRLGEIAAGSAQSAADAGDPVDGAANVADQPDRSPEATASDDADQALDLAPAKRDLLPFMVDDLTTSLEQLRDLLGGLASADDRIAHLTHMADLTAGLVRTAEFFEIDQLTLDVQALDRFCQGADELQAEALSDAAAGLDALIEAVGARAEAIGQNTLLGCDTAALRDAVDQLFNPAESARGTQSPRSDASGEPSPSAGVDEANQARPADAAAQPRANAGANASAERTIRVDVERLESLLNLVGELVLQKNRVLGLGRAAMQKSCDQDIRDQLVQVGSEIERVTADLQTGVMKTRMQPLNKLFNRYPRLVRDLARAMDKQINLEIVGGDTEVDKSVIESLGDPLVHILRNSADHGLEPADDRKAAGKAPCGTIRLSARHDGNHVVVEIADDGRGLDAERIGRKTVERGLISEDQRQNLSKQELHNLIFQPGFSLAEKVSDVSGRGVGMDVVRTNINRLNGMIDVMSELGGGTTIAIRIPLTVAIMRAMVVRVDEEVYAVPLSNIIEILRADPNAISAVAGQPVMRVRDSVLPLVDLRGALGGDRAGATAATSPIVVIVGLGERRLALGVTGLFGQEEVVIKALDDHLERHTAISGATIREDGSVSLILDVAGIFKSVEQRPGMAA